MLWEPFGWILTSEGVEHYEDLVSVLEAQVGGSAAYLVWSFPSSELVVDGVGLSQL